MGMQLEIFLSLFISIESPPPPASLLPLPRRSLAAFDLSDRSLFNRRRRGSPAIIQSRPIPESVGIIYIPAIDRSVGRSLVPQCPQQPRRQLINL